MGGLGTFWGKGLASRVPLAAPRRAGARAVGRPGAGRSAPGFGLQGCRVDSGPRLFQMCWSFSCLSLDREFFFPSSRLLCRLSVLGRGLRIWNLLAGRAAYSGRLLLLCRPWLMSSPRVLRQLLLPKGRGNAREPDGLSPLFLGRRGGGLRGELLHGGPEKRQLHFLRTVARVGARMLCGFGMGRAEERQFAGVSFLSWRRPGRGGGGWIGGQS